MKKSWKNQEYDYIQVCLQKLKAGDALDDDQLNIMISLYEDMQLGLFLLGEEFQIAWEPIFRRLNSLTSFRENRRKRK